MSLGIGRPENTDKGCSDRRCRVHRSTVSSKKDITAPYKGRQLRRTGLTYRVDGFSIRLFKKIFGYFPVFSGAHKNHSYPMFGRQSISQFQHRRSPPVLRTPSTARRQAEASLKESERRLRNAQKMAHIGNWELDLVKNKLVWSDEIFRIFEIDPASFDASYEAFLAAVHPDDRDAVNAAYVESLGSHTQYEMSHRLLMPDGRVKDVHEHCKTAYSPAGKPLRSVGTVQDITDRMRSEREATELRRELAHLGRTTTLNELASSLAHEINQPLGAILRNAEAAELLLGEDPPGLTELTDIIVDIRKDDQRASAIINRMREMVRRHDMTFEALSLKDVVDQVAGLVKVEAQSRGAVVGVRLPPGLPSVRGDAIHLQQVLLNLILNGLEAMDGLPCERVIEVQACLMDPETVEVAVRDRGRGIPAEALPRLFEAFFTTKSRGLGMGLLISRTCIESHGGKMWAENNPEGGATVRFTLKVAEGGGTA